MNLTLENLSRCGNVPLCWSNWYKKRDETSCVHVGDNSFEIEAIRQSKFDIFFCFDFNSLARFCSSSTMVVDMDSVITFCRWFCKITVTILIKTLTQKFVLKNCLAYNFFKHFTDNVYQVKYLNETHTFIFNVINIPSRTNSNFLAIFQCLGQTENGVLSTHYLAILLLRTLLHCLWRLSYLSPLFLNILQSSYEQKRL